MLRVEGIEVEIDGVQVLRGVSLDLEPGKVKILVGRNGAGKTTTLRSIMGLIPSRRGRVLLGDQRIDDLPAHTRPGLGIGYAPEDRRLVGEFTVEENILLPVLALALPPAEQKRRLENVYCLLPQVAEIRKRSGGSTSGGQGKMVALGRALMVAQKVLLLDEPFQGLAPALALNYAQTLARLKQDRGNIAFLVTESSPHLIEHIADETFQIERGVTDRVQPSERESD